MGEERFKEIANTVYLIGDNGISKQQMLVNRHAYLNAPITKQAKIYYCYDYYSKTELEFESIDSIISYLNCQPPEYKQVTRSFISSTLGDARKRCKTALIKGFGISSDVHSRNYFPYTEEIILSSKRCYPAPVRVYKVIVDGKEDIIYTSIKLCKYFNYTPNKSINLVTPEEIMQFINVPNLSIVRLNSKII
jgi:hypothetical protein